MTLCFLCRLGLSAQWLARPDYKIQLPRITTYLFGTHNSSTVNRRLCFKFAHDTQVFCELMNWTTLVTAQCLLHLPGFIFNNSLCTLLKTPTHLNILTFINVTKTSCTPQFKQFVSHGLRTTTKFYSDNRCIFTHEAAGRKFTSLFFFPFCSLLKIHFKSRGYL